MLYSSAFCVTERVDHDRVVDDEIDRHERVDLLRIAARLVHGVAHGRQVDDDRHAGEVLQHDAGGNERRFPFSAAPRLAPVRQLAHMLFGNGASVELANGRFQQHFDRVRELGNAGESSSSSFGSE